MSKRPSIESHEQALSVYLNDMLTESLDTPPPVQQPDIAEQKLPIQQAIINAKKVNAEESWRDKPFQALLFDVQGLTLALPLHELNGIHNYPESKLPRLPGKPAWYTGLFKHQEHQSQVVDTAHIIMPQGYEHDNLAAKYIIIIDDHRWGLSCNNILRVTTLEPDQISWRQNLGKRPWLAGTVLSQMCSILDVKMLAKQLGK